MGRNEVICPVPSGVDRSLATYFIVGDTSVWIDAFEGPNQASEILAKLP